MKIARTQVTGLTITDAPGLDPIDVFIVNYEPGKGRMTIRCWDRAWTCAWFAMGGQSIEQFFLEAGSEYIVDNLTCGLHGMRKDMAKRDAPYLTRIVEAVKAALRAPASQQHTDGGRPLTRCAAGRDGECSHSQCPQLRDDEPTKSGRHCPLDNNQD